VTLAARLTRILVRVASAVTFTFASSDEYSWRPDVSSSEAP
jgi:hypothetical protein